jgi:hypothetical protein
MAPNRGGRQAEPARELGSCRWTVLEQGARHPVTGAPVSGVEPDRRSHRAFHNDILS